MRRVHFRTGKLRIVELSIAQETSFATAIDVYKRQVQGRRVLALDGFEAALTDKAAKQRMWAYIKQLTPAAAPL